MIIKNLIFLLIRYLHKIKIIPSKLFINILNFKMFKRKINWRKVNSNLRLNEKIQIYKITIKKNPLINLVADKILIRDYIKKKVNLKFPKILFVTKDIKSFDFNSLLTPLVIKANHGSGMYDIIKNPEKIIWNKKKIIYKKWLTKNFFYDWGEPQYKDIEPILFGEELLTNKDGSDIIDYKFHCINGKVEFIHVASERTGNTKRNFFSTKWEEIEMYWGPTNIHKQRTRKKNKDLKKPKYLNRMIKISEHLSNEFDYVRVDLMICKNSIYFGELTLHPGSGMERFIPDELDYFYGKMLKLN